jgi:thermostable 8-oxoguanine DNA glycosylase
MIDPSRITNYNLSIPELQEMLLFWILVAGKNAKTTSRILENFLQKLRSSYGNKLPFELILSCDEDLGTLMKGFGFGCFNTKAKSIKHLISKNFDLKTCTVEQLETVHGIGPKTARCFVIHTRKNSRHAGLDTHVLKWLASQGHNVPKSTPKGKVYTQLENTFLGLCDKLNMDVAELDLLVWRKYANGEDTLVDVERKLGI